MHRCLSMALAATVLSGVFQCSPSQAQVILRAVPELPGALDPPEAGPGDSPMGPFDLDWYSFDGGGATYLIGGSGAAAFELGAAAGQPDAGVMSGGGAGGFVLAGGFWPGTGTGGETCYANCDGSTIAPILNVNDFTCFVNLYASGHPTANCDGSSIPPVLNINDFICFQQKFAAGCT